MSATAFQELEEVKGLITRGQQIGVLTYAEIATATGELALDETDVEELHGLIERFEIELVDEIDPAAAASLNIERAPGSAPPPRLRWISGRKGLRTRWRCSSRTSARRGC